jgi:hypothetical protein
MSKGHSPLVALMLALPYVEAEAKRFATHVRFASILEENVKYIRQTIIQLENSQ